MWGIDKLLVWSWITNSPYVILANHSFRPEKLPSTAVTSQPPLTTGYNHGSDTSRRAMELSSQEKEAPPPLLVLRTITLGDLCREGPYEGVTSQQHRSRSYQRNSGDRGHSVWPQNLRSQQSRKHKRNRQHCEHVLCEHVLKEVAILGHAGASRASLQSSFIYGSVNIYCILFCM